MAYVPFSPQNGCKYVLTLGGARVTFNDPSDADNVGALSDITGLDSAEVRESAEDLVQADGGAHGNFYWGRRPIVITGVTYGHATDAIRDERLDRIRRASAALRSDAILQWQNTPTGSTLSMQTWVRRQQPLRLTGGWNKDFQISLVSQYAPLFGAALKNPIHTNASPSFTTENQGDWPSYPIIRIQGPTLNPTITNTTTGRLMKFTTGFTLSAAQYADLDVVNRTLTRNDGTSLNSSIDFVLSTWPTVDKGNNTFTMTGTSQTGVTALSLYFRDAWS